LQRVKNCLTLYFAIIQDLKDYMRQAGEVSYADAHKNKRGEGVVEFAKYDDMKTAIEKLDGTELNGKKIRLTEAKRRRSASKSKSRSKSPTTTKRRKSRSKSR
jgi:arginine/serine-rich splicing factor 4/5/6